MATSIEDIPLARLWSRRMTMAGEEPTFEEFFASIEDVAEVVPKSGRCSPNPLFDEEDKFAVNEVEDEELIVKEVENLRPVELCLNGATLGDIPARYTIPTTRPHEFAVVGVWIDPRVVPGFRYKVRPIHDPSDGLPAEGHFFDGRALALQSIGRGYSRRITFEADEKHLCDNDNYFWSDSWPHGFAFELEVISTGDKFTLYDVENIPLGTVEVAELMGPQEEIRSVVLPNGNVEKTVRVRMMCKIEWFEEDGPSEIAISVAGLAVCVKVKGSSKAVITKVMRVTVGHKRGYNLMPGVCSSSRRVIVSGEAVGDIPTKYTIVGLKTHEIPVIGTYVDPRILPGFDYRVRPCGSNEYLFDGRALTLLNVGMGYGKRITFAPDPNCLNRNDNYFWSDSNPDGFGFEPRAVHTGMKFIISSGGQKLGEASVFRTDYTQEEIRQELVKRENGTAVTKYIHVDVTCNVVLNSSKMDEYDEPEAMTMRVSGTAVVTREPRQAVAQLQRIEHVGLASQLNVLFVIQETELTFYPV